MLRLARHDVNPCSPRLLRARPRRDDVAAAGHVVEDEFGAGRRQIRSLVEARKMTGADEPEHPHPGGPRGGDAGDAVLDHQAVLRRGAHRARCEKEEIGTGLSLRDLGGGKNVGREQGLITGNPKREAEPLGRARRGDANARPQAPDRLAHALDPLEFASKCRENIAREIVGKLLRQRRAEFGLDLAHDRIEPQPQETLACLLIGQVKASLAEPAHGSRRARSPRCRRARRRNRI